MTSPKPEIQGARQAGRRVHVVNQILPASIRFYRSPITVPGKTGPAGAARDFTGHRSETAAIFRLSFAKVAAGPFCKLVGDCGCECEPSNVGAREQQVA